MNVLVAWLLAALVQVAGSGLSIDPSTGDAVPCEQVDGRWTCPGRSDPSPGIIVIDTGPDSWGRVVRVDPGGAAAGDLHDLALTAWRPERSAVRQHLRRFRPVRDESVHVMKVGDAVFWVSGAAVDPDAFLSLDGRDIGRVRVATQQLKEDAPEIPFVIAAPMAVSLLGRVRNVRGDDVSAAKVEVFEPLRQEPDQKLTADTPVIARGIAVTDGNGVFTFDRAPDGPLLLVASAADGRASAWVTAIGPPVVIDLTPPLQARGRVVRHGIGVAGARVHFVPSAEAWAASEDPMANLADEVVAGDDGAFVLALPEQAAGEVQVVTADGLTARVPVLNTTKPANRMIDLGDVAIQEPRRVIIRLLEPIPAPPCDLVAIGPIGSLGLQVVRASSPANIFTLDLPETGQWTFSAECGGTSRTVSPTIVAIASARTEADIPTIDVRFGTK